MKKLIRTITYNDYILSHQNAAQSKPIPIQKKDGSVIEVPSAEDLTTEEEWNAQYGGDVVIEFGDFPDNAEISQKSIDAGFSFINIEIIE